MSQCHFSTYSAAIRALTPVEIGAAVPPAALLMEQDGPVSVYYAPFDLLNRDARLVLVGITPGRTQMDAALRAAREHLTAGLPDAEVMRRAKQTASFSGSMRGNLVAMLDFFRIHEVFGIGSCAELFTDSAHLVHYTSALRYPVFVDGVNYNKSPAMTRHRTLRRYLLTYFAAEVEAMPDAVFVPLGGTVAEALEFVAQERGFGRDRFLTGLQHPSDQNKERVAYLIGRKAREAVSRQVPVDRIDRDREEVRARVERLLACPTQRANSV